MFGVNVHIGKKYAWLDYDLFNQPYDLSEKGQHELEVLWCSQLKAIRGGTCSWGCISGMFGLGGKKLLISDIVKLGLETVKIFNKLGNRELKYLAELNAEKKMKTPLRLNLVRGYRIVEVLDA